MKELECSQHYTLIFQTPKGSLPRNLWWDLAKIPARIKKIQLKWKALESSQDFSHYKYMGIFPDAQGQLTLQSIVGFGRISNSSKTKWLSLLSAKMKKIRSKM